MGGVHYLPYLNLLCHLQGPNFIFHDVSFKEEPLRYLLTVFNLLHKVSTNALLSEPDNRAEMPWEFTEENMERCKGIIAQYPDGHQQAAAIPLLDLGISLSHNLVLFYYPSLEVSLQ